MNSVWFQIYGVTSEPESNHKQKLVENHEIIPSNVHYWHGNICYHKHRYFFISHDNLYFHLELYHYIHIVKCNTKLPPFVTIHEISPPPQKKNCAV